MYLQSLEIQGFKSFANRTLIEFHRGVTAIVGPNGCGKSNVLDSIRWVLGEQSAKALRGGEMADVIFSGTDSRAAVGMAEVSMTFAECEAELGLDYHEVRITRRVFRDGRSEYLLNKTPCRLRDIHLLFMDTGIGRSAYSIMEQGKIDQILSSRPEERRAIFEEAAGITKYKSQKKEALRKLEFTEANLLRLTDVMREVKRQIGSLQRQAGKARRYQSLLGELRILDTHLSRKRHDDLQKEILEIDSALTQITDNQQSTESHVTQLENGLTAKKMELAEMETRIADARQRVQDLKNDIANGESRIGFNRERIVEFGTLAERYQTDLAAGEEKLLTQESQIADTDQQLEEASSLLTTEEAALASHSDAVTKLRDKRVAAETALRQSDTTLSQSEGRSNALRTELANLTGQHQGTEARTAALTQELTTATTRRDELAGQIATARETLQSAQTRLSEAREQQRQLEERLKTAQSDLSQMEKELTAAQRAVAENDSRLSVLRQLNEEGAGLGAGTQAVLKGPNKAAILGSLASQIETEPEFITAIETALGAQLQTILLKESMVVPQIFETLVQKKQGRAALAPVELQSNGGHEQHFLPEGALAWALDKVKVDAPAQPLVRQLLGKTLLVADLDAALKLRASHPDHTFAALDGTILSADGVIQGGQTSDAANSVLARKNQITALQKTLEAARETLAAAEKRRSSSNEMLETLRTDLQSRRDLVQEAHLAGSSAQSQLANLERDLRDSENKVRTLEWERDSLAKRAATATASIEQTTLQLAELAALISSHQDKRSELQSTLDQARDEENRLSETLSEARIRVATERQRAENLRRQRQPMAARLTELRELIAQRKNDIQAYRERTITLEKEIEGITSRVATSRDGLGSAEKVAGELQEERKELIRVTGESETSLREARKRLFQFQEERGQKEIRKTQIGLKLESIFEHIQRRYQMDLASFTPDTYGFNVAVRDLKARAASKSAVSDHSNPSAEPGTHVSDLANPLADSGTYVSDLANPSADPGTYVSDPANPSANPGTRVSDLPNPLADAGTSAFEGPNPSAEASTSVSKASENGEDWAFVERAVAELTERVDAIGPVNLEAIQEFDELEERGKFLDEQNNDLVRSKAELLDAIAKINHTTKQLFADTFEQIRVNFQEMFTELFGGGKANLLLTDDSDPLESGIEIVAKPPGKQLSSITLLSGGEKTMTAVALLFSIYMVKPSPFCVLDEMDAPLDESNINRFIKILDRFVAQSQFVVITHNKRTIAKADVLYGVTMEEQGVSKLVGVKLTRREDSVGGHELEGANPPSIAESFGKSGNLHSESPGS
ncbi:MAG: chromosome segregation protein SMC [Chthoniobacterales bacterium]